MQGRIHANLAASSNLSHSTLWKETKASGKANVLYNPIVQTAWTVATTIHAGQRRDDGTSMMAHLEETAILAAMLGLDAPPVAAALLHECLAESDMTAEMLRSLTTQPVADLVEGVAKATRLTDLYGNQGELRDQVRVCRTRLRFHQQHCASCLSPTKGVLCSMKQTNC